MYYNLEECGSRIRDLRRQNGLTQEQVAARLGIYVSHYGKIERGACGVSVDLLVVLSDFFAVSLDYIILGRKTETEYLKSKINTVLVQLQEIEAHL